MAPIYSNTANCWRNLSRYWRRNRAVHVRCSREACYDSAKRLRQQWPISYHFFRRRRQSNYYYAASSAPPAAACNFSAANVEGPDEFTVYASIDRISSCSETIGISYSVTYISGSGQYNVGGFWPAGSSILPSDQYKLLSISPFYGTVLPGSPLRLKLTWNVISGSGSISPSEAFITFYNSDCYC